MEKTEEQTENERPLVVIDATNAILGRLASYVAKQALLGKRVAVINSEHAIITGKRRMIIEEYKIARKRGGDALKGPFFPKYSDRLLKRTIRGMLHYNHGRGKAAFKRIKCYIGIPKEFEKAKAIHVKHKELATTTLRLSEVSKEL